jgi:nucleoside-diphosphate-sugar epimerase
MNFVTGGTGLVGAHLLYELAKSGQEVKALKRENSNIGQVLKTFGYYSSEPEALFRKIEWVNGDILDMDSLEKALDGVACIYHCAAIVSFRSSDRRKMISNNVEGTANMVNAALEKGVRRFCHVSSIAALGRNTLGLPVTEETNWVPSRKVSGYSESKFFSETEVWRGIEEGLNAVIVNPSIILGPANWNSGSAKLFKTVADGMKFYTKGTTGFVDVADVVKAMLLLTSDNYFEKCKNQRFLLSAQDLSYQQLFGLIADALGKKRPSIYASNLLLGILWRMATLLGKITFNPTSITREAVANSNSRFCFDGSKITKTTGMEYRLPEETIKEVAGFYLKDIRNKNN